MVAEPKRWLITPEEYLIRENRVEEKHEYLGGAMLAVGPCSINHVRISSNLIGHLGNQLQTGPCEVFASRLRVFIRESGDYIYPDLVAACEAQFIGDNLLNPVVIIEVLSPSTELKDRTIKFEALRRNASLMDYVLVSQTRVYIDHYHRQDDNSWNLRSLETREDELILESIGCRLKGSEIYARVELPSLQVVPQNQGSEETKND
jgi:Uma2 family endonuclease